MFKLTEAADLEKASHSLGGYFAKHAEELQKTYEFHKAMSGVHEAMSKAHAGHAAETQAHHDGDVMTLAHELGHGLHQYLSRGQGYFQCDTPLTTAEMASVFGEMLTFRRLQELYPEPKHRLAMLCSKIEDGFATVFRQVVLTRFEQSLHAARQTKGELSPTADQRALAGGEPADVRRRGADLGRLRLVVVVHRPLHPLAVLLLRLRLRRTAGAGAGAEVPRGGTDVRAEVPGAAVVGRLRCAAGAAGQARRGRRRSEVLGAGAAAARRAWWPRRSNWRRKRGGKFPTCRFRR